MNKKTLGVFILFLSGFTLLVGSSASSISYNSHYMTYSYLNAFNSKQNSKDTANLSDSLSDIMLAKKIKRSRFETNLVSDNFYKSLVKGKYDTIQIKQFGENDVILGKKENDLTKSLLELVSLIKQAGDNPESTISAFVKNTGLKSDLNHETYIFSDTANSTIILLSISALGCFLILYREEKIQRFNTKKILSFGLAFMIAGSVVLTPISLSFNFGDHTYGIIPFANADDGHDHSHHSEHCDETPHGVSAPTATALAGDKIALSWAIPESEDDDHPIVGYEIDYSTNGGVTWVTSVSNTTSHTPSYTVSGFVTGTSYNFRIEALNQCGQSQHLGVASPATIAGDVPSKVTGLSTTVVSSSQINLSWIAPNYNAYHITGYKIERSTDGITFSTIVANTTTTATTYSDTGLSSNTLYYYKVSAINLLGTGLPSSLATGISIPLPPTNIAATSILTSQINLSWIAPSGTINGYKIERSQDSGNTWSIIVANTTTTATTYSDTGLLSNTYYYRISSLSTGGTSNPSAVASATTIPTPPTNLLSSAVSISQINLSWIAPPGTILGYKIERSTDGITFSTIIANTTTTATTYSDTGLSSNTLYTYRISSLGLDGTISTPSGTTSMTTLPSSPSSLVTTALSGNAIEISWVASTGAAQILGYKIEKSTDGSTWSVLVTNNNNDTSYKDTGLALGQAYYYRVSAINSGGTGSPSRSSAAVTSGDIPSAISAPTVVVYSGGIMNVTWAVPASNRYPITSYNIDYSTNGGASYATFATVTGNPPISHYLVTGLIVGSSYQWRIEADNSLGSSVAGISSDPSIALPSLKIETQTIYGNMTRGAAYSISPNPNGRSTYIVVDGGTGDSDGTNDGTVTVNMIPFGTYRITITTIPSGYEVLGNSTTYTEGPTQLNGVIDFRLLLANTVTSSLQSTVITTQPSLNNTVLTTWTSTFHATKINDTSTSFSSVTQLPPILFAGDSNTDAVKQAVSNQATVQLNTTFSTSTSSSDIMKTLGVPTYSVPKISDMVSVIPTIATTNDDHNGQIVTTPPLSAIIPGQQMIIPVQSSVIPDTGGVKEISVQSATDSSSNGVPKSDWFVIRVNDTMPSSLPPLPNTVNKTTLYVNVTYPYEDAGNGFNWGNPSNFAQPPSMTLLIPKPTSGVPVDANGCPASAIFVYDTNTKSWTSNPVTILSITPTVGDSNSCDVVVQTQHFSQFAIGTVFPSVSSSHGDYTPGTAPSFTAGFTPDQYPLIIDGTGFKLDLHTNTVPSTTYLDVGKPFLLKLLVHGDNGPLSVQHVTLFTNLYGTTRQLQDSDTMITWDRGAQTQLALTDPHGYFKQVTVNTHAEGLNLALEYNMTFAKPMPKSDIIFRTWGSDLYSSDTYLLDAWGSTGGIMQVTPSPLLQVQTVSNDTATTTIPKPLTSQPDIMETIKKWGGYSSKSISDSEMLHAFGLRGSHVPSWMMKNTQWVVDGTMTQQDFGNALKYLSDNNIIK